MFTPHSMLVDIRSWAQHIVNVECGVYREPKWNSGSSPKSIDSFKTKRVLLCSCRTLLCHVVFRSKQSSGRVCRHRSEVH
jgi:hypothetical protein